MKVNCYPFLFQVDLFDTVDTNKSSAIVDEDGVHFFMVKVSSCPCAMKLSMGFQLVIKSA